MSDREAMRAKVCATLDLAHHALRCVDASDATLPQEGQTLDCVSKAVAAIERTTGDLGYRLSEFRGQHPGETT